ncbi:MAG: cyclic nucleotide-binding domain-containing protein [Deltaproteobacteria bacterium]|nr:cyclic nucleotide-binding domain-containing protein [Deltaproteobacteria bacterium]
MSYEDSGLASIAESHLFRSLDETGQRRLLAACRRVSFQPGQVIVREGDPGEALYLVKDGWVRVHTTRAGRDIPLATLGRGACFGEVALLSGRPRTATVSAVNRCTLLCFQRTQIEEVLDAYPKVRRLLESMVLGRARDTIEKLTRPS